MPPVLTKQYVSNMGRYTTVFGKKSYGSVNSSGYVHCKITKGSSGESKEILLHRLVCRAFNGPPGEDRMEVDHKNGNKWDARASNLEWVTHSENVKRTYENDERRTSAAALGKPILIRKFGTQDEWVRYNSRSDAACAFGIVISGAIASVAADDGGRSHCGGYEFKEVEDDIKNDPSEAWRPLEGFDGCFVSNNGRFRYPDGRITLGAQRAEGYYVVQINQKKHVMKDLVAKAFANIIGPCPTPSHKVSFKDFSKKNRAAVDNLCWRTPSEKMAASHAQGCRKYAQEKEKKRVFSREINAKTWTLHDSQGECALSLGISAGTLSQALTNKKPAKGFEFCYEPQDDLDGEEWVEIEDEWMN